MARRPTRGRPTSYIFPGVTTCPTLNGCATNIYNVYSVNQNFRTPYFYNYNVQMEKALGEQGGLQVGYVGSAAHKLNVMLNLNQNGAFNAPYPDVGSILQLNSNGTSNYNALQATLKMHGWHGFTAQFAYTWAHALDEVTEYRGVDSLRQLQSGAGLWKQRLRHPPGFHRLLDLRHSRVPRTARRS